MGGLDKEIISFLSSVHIRQEAALSLMAFSNSGLVHPSTVTVFKDIMIKKNINGEVHTVLLNVDAFISA